MGIVPRGRVVVCWECGQLSDQTLDDCCFAVTRSWAQRTVGIPCLNRCRGGTCLQGGKSRTVLINCSRPRTRFEDSLSEDISNAQKLNGRLYMKTNYNILYEAIREVFIKNGNFWWHLMAANEKFNFTSFPEVKFCQKLPCFLAKKYPQIYGNSVFSSWSKFKCSLLKENLSP